MYAIVKCYVKSNYVWSEKDISAETLTSIIADYQSVRVTTLFTGDTVNSAFTFNQNIKALEEADKSLTLTAWLATFTTATLIGGPAPRGLSDSTAVDFYDFYDLPVTVERSNIGYGEGQKIPTGLSTDIRFKSNAPSYDERATANINKNMLIVLNGRIVDTSMVDNWCYIIDGVTRLNDENSTTISAWDFTDIGGLTKHPLTVDNLRLIPRTPIDIVRNVSRVVATVETSMLGTVPMVIMDGNAHVMDGCYKELSTTEMLITVNHQTAITRALSRPHYNLGYIDAANVRGEGVVIDTFDAVKYLAQTDSFIAAINNDDIAFNTEKLTDTGVIGEYTHYRSPKGIIRFEDYTIAPYKISDYSEVGVAISTIDNIRMPLAADTVGWKALTSIGEGGVTSKKRRLMGAYAFDIYMF